MSRIGLAALLFALASALPSVPGAARPAVDDTACGMDLMAVASAMNIKSYAAAEGNMGRAMKSCAAPYPGKEDLAFRLGTLADVQLRQAKWAAGLESAERCIAAYRPAPDCHFYRWFALHKLRREGDAAAERPVAQAAMETFLALKPDTVSKEARKELESRQETVREYLRVLTNAAK